MSFGLVVLTEGCGGVLSRPEGHNKTVYCLLGSLALDNVLGITAIVLILLSLTHVCSLPPAANYSLAGTMLAMGIVDFFGVRRLRS